MQVVLADMVTCTPPDTEQERRRWVLLFSTTALLAASVTRSYAMSRRTQSGARKECRWQSPPPTFAHQTTLRPTTPEGGATHRYSISTWLSLLGRRSGFTEVESSPLSTKGPTSFLLSWSLYTNLQTPSSGIWLIVFNLITCLLIRVPCKKHGGVRFAINGRDYFELVLITNVGNAGAIRSVKVKGSKTGWMPMSRNWGANWQSNSYLNGQSMSFMVTTTDGITKTFTNIVPSSWTFGQTFSSRLQFWKKEMRRPCASVFIMIWNFLRGQRRAFSFYRSSPPGFLFPGVFFLYNIIIYNKYMDMDLRSERCFPNSLRGNPTKVCSFILVYSSVIM